MTLGGGKVATTASRSWWKLWWWRRWWLVVVVTVMAIVRVADAVGKYGLEDACPDFCVCRTDEEDIARRRAKSVACVGTNSSELPANLSSSIEVIRFPNNSVRRVDFFSLKRFPSLLYLDLSSNGINELAGSGKTLPKLKHLDLSINNLHIIQSYAFRDFPELQSLNLSWNGIHTISPSGFILPNLNVLDLRSNRLSILKPHYFSDTPNLQAVFLSNNVISRIPEFVFGKNLHRLDLSYNHIMKLEENAFDGINITGELNLANNALRRVPNAPLKRLGRVENLIMDSNLFHVLTSGSVVGLTARRLSMSYQKNLHLIHKDVFVNLEELEELYIRGNPFLTYVHPESVINAPKLRLLDISSNSLYTIESDLLKYVPNLKELRVSNNSFTCHCSLKWVQELINTEKNATEDDGLADSVDMYEEGKDSDLDVYCSDRNGTHLPIVHLVNMSSTCSPYIIPLFPASYHDVLGNNVSFHCRALGSPDIKVHWVSKSGVRLYNNKCNGRLCVRDHTLTIHYLHHDDGGSYACTAKNEKGTDSRAVNLYVRDINVQLFPLTVTSTFVTLSWNMSNMISNNYMLKYESEDEGEEPRSVRFSVGVKMHSYTVHGLKPGVTYSFSLCIEREEYTIVICTISVTTKEENFLLTLGIERSYLSVILVSVVIGIVLASCVGFCGLKCWRQRLKQIQESEMRKSDSLSGRSILQSSSTHSDMAFITYINLTDDAIFVEQTESNFGYT